MAQRQPTPMTSLARAGWQRLTRTLGNDRAIAGLAAKQVPWSVSSPAVAAALACSSTEASVEAARRAERIEQWRAGLIAALDQRGYEVVGSETSFVLAKLGRGTRQALREHGVAVRRADTFPGLDGEWVRIAVRPPETTHGGVRVIAREDFAGGLVHDDGPILPVPGE